MFASDGDTPTLRLVWANDTEDQSGYVITETPVDGGQYPALSDIAPAAFVEECEIYEQFGIRPATGKPLNRVMLPPHADLPTLGRKPPSEPEEARAPHTVAGEAFEFPFGPVRQAGVESLYYGLVTSGEEVVDLYLFTWHKHRGLEWRLQGKTPQQALFLAERAEGLSAVAMGWAFAAAAEAATGVRPPGGGAAHPRRRARTGAAVQPRRRDGGAVPVDRAVRRPVRRRDRPRTAAPAERPRVRPPVPVRRDRRRRRQPRARRRTRSAKTCPAPTASSGGPPTPCSSTNSFVDRLEATGTLTAAQARALGLVGPVARATGLAADARLVPGGPYRAGTGSAVAVATATAGDVARPLHRHARRGRRVRPPDRPVPRRGHRGRHR